MDFAVFPFLADCEGSEKLHSSYAIFHSLLYHSLLNELIAPLVLTCHQRICCSRGSEVRAQAREVNAPGAPAQGDWSFLASLHELCCHRTGQASRCVPHTWALLERLRFASPNLLLCLAWRLKRSAKALINRPAVKELPFSETWWYFPCWLSDIKSSIKLLLKKMLCRNLSCCLFRARLSS